MEQGVTARAIVARDIHGPLELCEVRLQGLRAHEALVRIRAVGICHADVSCLHGVIPVRFPNIFGHEGAGIVEAVGEDVQEVDPGDHVLLSYNSCGACAACLGGCPAYCTHMMALNFGGTRLDGSHTTLDAQGCPIYSNFFGQSAFSSLAVVNRRCLVKVPNDLPLEICAPLGCGIQTGAGSIFNALDIQPGATVAIFGTGSVGMAAIMAAKIRAAKVIIGIDLDDRRLALATGIGATHTLNNNVCDVPNEIRRICDSDGVLYAMDATGVASVIDVMIQSLGTKGHAVSIGAPRPGTLASVDVFKHLTMGRRYSGSNQGDSVPQIMIPLLIEYYKNGKLPLDRIVTTYGVTEHDKALEDMKSGEVVKPVLIWPDEHV